MEIKFLRSFTYLINAIVSVCKLQNIKLEVDAVKQIQTILVQETQLLKLETVLLFPMISNNKRIKTKVLFISCHESCY